MFYKLFMGLKSFIRFKIITRIYRKNIEKYILSFSNKNVLEIGGPSKIFNEEVTNSYLPMYAKLRSLTNVNFSYETIWENKIIEGNTFKYGKRTGIQFVLEASNLNKFEDNQFEGLISSHCLEHTANPIKVIFEWKRVVSNNGFLLIILPNKKYTFDHKRPTSSMAHLIEDFNNNVEENDLTHLTEILELHDKTLDFGLNGIDFEERSKNNFQNRCLHHHVFDDVLMQQLADYTDLNFIQKNNFGIHLIYLLQKK